MAKSPGSQVEGERIFGTCRERTGGGTRTTAEVVTANGSGVAVGDVREVAVVVTLIAKTKQGGENKQQNRGEKGHATRQEESHLVAEGQEEI